MAVRFVVLLVAASCVVGFPAPAVADTTINFEQYPAGTVLTDQYKDFGGPGQGVVFGPLPSGMPSDGLKPVIRVPPAGQAQSGSQVADIATCPPGCEPAPLTPRTTATFAARRSQVSVRVGYLGEPGICTSVDPNAVTCAFVKLRAFDVDGNQLAESSVRVARGAGVHSLLSVSTPAATIVGIEISARPMVDDSKKIAIDDLSFGAPAAPRPDFTLNPATTSLIVEQGGSASDAITIGRLEGSSGDIELSAEGLPAGVSAGFAPNPAPGTQSTLTLSAAPTASLTNQTVTITGTPRSASAGPASRRFSLNLVVQRACPQVDTAQELVDALARGFKCIFVTGRINLARDLARVAVPSHLTDIESALVIPEGVTLMGGRSPTQPGGTLAMSGVRRDGKIVGKQFMLKLSKPNTRITGLRLQGYNERDTKARGDLTTAIFVETGDVTIDNNEMFGWPRAAVEVQNTPVCVLPSGRTRNCESAPLISQNYIHNNVQCNAGYGVLLDGPFYPPGFARIERNVFAFNRHHIASSGGKGPGYSALLNFALHRGPKCDGRYNQHFDAHGEFGGYGGFAGTFFAILHNTFRGGQSYGFAGRLTRPAFTLRGTPEERVVFANNALAHCGASRAVQVQGRGQGNESLKDLLIRFRKLVIRGNKTAVDTAHELAVGDFNGDGRDDVFQAVGTLWVYSPSGQREWFFLNASNLRLNSLGLGDFNGDRKSDVFFRRGDRWQVSYGGTSGPRPLPVTSKIDVRRYRFGDFDGDGRTDVFRANGRQFFYSSAGTTQWNPLAASGLAIDELRFGDFNGDGKTDVFSLANNQWSVSDGGRTRWRRLNRKLSSKLGSLVFADFNGDRKTDIARTNGRRWEFSSGGATAWRTLASGRSEPLSIGMLFGDFNGDGRDDVLQHGAKSARIPRCDTTTQFLFRSFERFKLSPGGARPLNQWSVHDMR